MAHMIPIWAIYMYATYYVATLNGHHFCNQMDVNSSILWLWLYKLCSNKLILISWMFKKLIGWGINPKWDVWYEECVLYTEICFLKIEYLKYCIFAMISKNRCYIQYLFCPAESFLTWFGTWKDDFNCLLWKLGSEEGYWIAVHLVMICCKGG